jgi:hypothetical protein
MIIPDESLPPPGRGPRGIDHLLSAFPSGQLSEIVGPWSSGGSSLLLALLASITASGGLAALVDALDVLDPASAAAAGADLSRLLWVRCGGRLREAWSAVDLLARCPGFALVALDLGALPRHGRDQVPPAFCLRLQRAVKGSATILVLHAPYRLAGSAAALVVSMRPLGSLWIRQPSSTRFAGFTSEARVLRSRTHLSAVRGEGEGSCWQIEWRL